MYRDLKIKQIVCHDLSGLIGLNGELPWDIKEDMNHFVKMTKGGYLIMGSKTYKSIGSPLRGRVNSILSSKSFYDISRDIWKKTDISSNFKATVHRSVEQALDAAHFHFLDRSLDKVVWIIGGERVYNDTIHLTDEIHSTIILDSFHFKGDDKVSYYGQSLYDDFENVDSEYVETECGHKLTFNKFQRKNPA